MKKEIEIFILGGVRAFGVFVSLRKKYKHVSYFSNQEECLKLIHRVPDILIVDESLKDCNPMSFIGSIKRVCNAHILYLSNDRHFTHIIRAFNSGASDYIIKDSYLCYSIHKTVYRLLKRTNDLSTQISTYDCRNESALRFVYPFKFKIFQRLTRP